jgi:hypothetical protein
MADGIISEKALRIIPKNQKHRMGMAEASGGLLSMKALQLMTSGDVRCAHSPSGPRVEGLWSAEGRGDLEYEGVSPANLPKGVHTSGVLLTAVQRWRVREANH